MCWNYLLQCYKKASKYNLFNKIKSGYNVKYNIFIYNSNVMILEKIL